MTPEHEGYERSRTRVWLPKRWQYTLRLGMLVGLVFLLGQCVNYSSNRPSGVFGEMQGASARPVPRSRTSDAASQLVTNGTLQDWRNASRSENIRATSMIASSLGHSGPRAVEEMGSCLWGAYGPATSRRRLSEVAAACAIQLGW